MGKIICAGLGPGDPDLISVRADRAIRGARQIAYFRKKGREGQARRIVAHMLAPMPIAATCAARVRSSPRSM